VPTGRRTLLRSTRSRVLLGALGLLAATVAMSIIVDRAILLTSLGERIDRELVQEVGEFQRLAQGGVDPATGDRLGEDVVRIFDVFFDRNVPFADEVVLSLVGGRPYIRSAGAIYPIEELNDLVTEWAGVSDATFGSSETPGGSLRWLAVPMSTATTANAGTFVVGQFPSVKRAEIDDAVLVAMIAGFAAFLVASVLAWLIAGRVLAPLRQLAEGAAAVREEDLSHRIAVRGTGELADLSTAFNAMLDRVEDAVASQRAFLDDAGHELRTPLTIVRGHLELAPADVPLSASTRRLVFDELDRMGRIVDDLLVLAKADHPDFVVPSPTDVADLTVEIVEKARPLAARDWAVQPDAVVVAPLDRQRIIQAWMNLVRNAIQHTGEGDRIVVFARVVEGWIELGVEDTGEGVAQADRKRIFERFGRGLSARRTRTDGAGLGLAIASAIVVGHRGEITLRDTPAGGATFILRLPLEHQVPVPDPEESPWPES
jgi:two-component system OmpR family sensor kinase